jgi:predicted dehydrogenase
MCAVADLDQDRLESVKGAYPHLDATTDPDEVLEREDIDAVAIATPVHTHYDLAKTAIENGKHVLIEKPMTHSVETSEHLIELADQAGVTLMVDHTFIYTGAVRKINDLVESGELGRLYYFDSVRVNLGLFQHDINVLWDLAPHDISIMDHVLDPDPVAVAAHGAAHIDYSDEPIENITYLTVYYPDDLIAHIHSNWLAPVKVRKTLLGGSEKMIVYDDTEPDEKIKVYDKGVEIEPNSDPEALHDVLVSYRTGDMLAPRLDDTEALKREVRHFLDCIETGKQPVTDGQAGLDVVRILEAAQTSIDNDGARVSLAE